MPNIDSCHWWNARVLEAGARTVTKLTATGVRLFAGSLLLFTNAVVRRSLLTIVVLNISIGIEKHLFLHREAAELGSLGGLQLSLTNIALLGLYVGWFLGSRTVRMSSDTTPNAARNSKIVFPALAFLLFCTVSCFAASDITLALFGWASVLERFCLLLLLASTLVTKEEIIFVIRLTLIASIVQSLIMLAQLGGLIADLDFLGFKTRAEFAGAERISGTLGAPNMAAAYLSMMIVVMAGVLLARTQLIDKALAVVGLISAIVPLIATASRGGWASLFVGLTALAILRGRRLPRNFVWVTVLIIAVVVPFKHFIQDRLLDDDNGSSAARMPLNGLAIRLIADHPLTGVGVNNFAVAMQPYLVHGFTGEFVYTVHNTYLLVWAETGVGGVVVFVWILGSVTGGALRCSRSHGGMLGSAALGMAAALIGLMVQMSVDIFRSDAANYLLWLFAGLIVAIGRLEDSSVPALSRYCDIPHSAFH